MSRTNGVSARMGDWSSDPFEEYSGIGVSSAIDAVQNPAYRRELRDCLRNGRTPSAGAAQALREVLKRFFGRRR